MNKYDPENWASLIYEEKLLGMKNDDTVGEIAMYETLHLTRHPYTTACQDMYTFMEYEKPDITKPVGVAWRDLPACQNGNMCGGCTRVLIRMPDGHVKTKDWCRPTEEYVYCPPPA